MSEPTPVVTSLAVYPVKSCAGTVCDAAEVGETGFHWDRRWMVVDEQGRFVTQRSHPAMCLIEPCVKDGEITFDTPDQPSISIPLRPHPSDPIEVGVWKDKCLAFDEGEKAAGWFSQHLRSRVRLVRQADDRSRAVSDSAAEDGAYVSFADAFPFLLASESSLTELNQHLDTPVPMDRFRPNIVVSGCKAFAEDVWKSLRIARVVFHVVKPCTRCVVITTDQKHGNRHPEPLKVLTDLHQHGGKPTFGQNLTHKGEGNIKVGDAVHILT